MGRTHERNKVPRTPDFVQYTKERLCATLSRNDMHLSQVSGMSAHAASQNRLSPYPLPEAHVDDGNKMLDECNIERLKKAKNPLENFDFYSISGATDRR